MDTREKEREISKSSAQEGGYLWRCCMGRQKMCDRSARSQAL
jgi:hypothetical protein